MTNRQIVLGGGCFWCLEATFQQVSGIQTVESGYSGGQANEADYTQVCSGTTNHAEVVRLTFDEQAISLPALLEIFFQIHDPTTPNRQGNDIGPQYRSVIFYQTAEEKELIEKSINNAAKNYIHPIVTEVSEFKAFYKAENYHQNYFNDNSQQPYCQVVIAPKLKTFLNSLKAD